MANSLNPEQQIYADLMDEARLRLHAMRDAIACRDRWVPRLLQEFAYLQLRMLCEIIAVGCLVAHGDIKDSGTLKLWEAPRILKKLEELNADFFPRAVRFQKLPNGDIHLDNYNAPHLTKTELAKLWGQSGDFLHRGGAKNLTARHGKILNVDLDAIIEYGQKILNLLEQHVISSADKRGHLLVALAADDAGGNAMVFYAASPEP
jgi:hypothetical protein